METREVLDFFFRRRSVRRFLKKEIPPEVLESLLQAAMAAPSGNNTQPWEIVVVREGRIKEELSRVHRWVSMAAQAPAAVVFLGDKGSVWWRDDCAAAAENLLLAAANLGLAGVWCGIQEKEHDSAVRRILKAPDRLGVLGIFPIGYPEEAPAPHTKYRPEKIHYDRFGKAL